MPAHVDPSRARAARIPDRRVVVALVAAAALVVSLLQAVAMSPRAQAASVGSGSYADSIPAGGAAISG